MRVAFGHHARSGKDVAAMYVANKYHATILRFAQRVYDITNSIQRMMQVPAQKDPALLQLIGEGLRQTYGPLIWCNYVESQILNLPQSNLVIADLRHLNEALMLRRNGFILINIMRPDRIIDRNPNHPSETELNDYGYDYVIINDGTIDELYVSIDAILCDLLNH